jgi:PAS domain-containing protein
MARQMRELRDQLAETDELLLKERASLAHCRERMSTQEQAFAPTKAQLKAVRKLLLVAEVGEDGSLLGANRRLLRLLGAEEGPPPPWPAGWLAAWLQAQPRLHEGKAWQGRVALGDAAANSLWLQIGPLATAEGEPRRFLAVASELSPLERRHRELIDSLERQGELLDGLQAGGWAWDCEGDRLRLDRRLLAALGLPAAGPVSTPGQAFLNERLHADDAPAWREAVQATLQGRGERLQMDLRLRHADGAWLRFQLRGGVTRRGPEGEVLRLAGGLLPLPEAPQARAEGDWDGLLALAQRALGQGALRWEPAADRLHWNAAALDLLERAEAPPLPLALALLALHADDREPLREALHAAARGARWQGELRLLGALGGERRVRLSLAGHAEAVLGLLQPLPGAPRAAAPALPHALLQRCAAQGIQLPQAVQRFGGDIALLQRTARDLSASSRELPQQLQVAAEPAAGREAAQALHAFQAVAATLGCEALAQVARSGLQRLRAGAALEPAWIAEFTRRRQLTLETLLAAGNELLAPRLVEELAPSVGPDLEQLRRLVAAADPQAQTLLRLQREQLAPWLGERVERLDAALAAADYEAAKALLAA